MSDYNVINDVEDTLKYLLWSSMEHDGSIHGGTGIPGFTQDDISCQAPFQLVRDTDPAENKLSLYLYRVVENGERKNRPPEPLNDHLLRYPPLALNLFYLITPLTNNPKNDHRLLGKMMQIFYDNAIVKGPDLQGDLHNTAEELRIILNPISIEDVTKLWSAFMRPYRLSVSYEVKVIYIDSLRETGGERVRRKRLEFSQMSGT